MAGLISRFFDEGLDASISVDSKDTLIQEQNETLFITSMRTFKRGCFAAIFALPCLYYLYFTVTHPGIATAAIALLICPPLTIIALLLWRVQSSKVIDGKRRVITSRLRFFSYQKEVSEPLAVHGTLTLDWHWEAGGEGTNGLNVYTITGAPGKGLLFSTLDNYGDAHVFAERLSKFLGFALENQVPPEYRIEN